TQVSNNGTAVSGPTYAMMVQPGQNAEVKLRFFPTRINPAQHAGLLVVENNVTTQSTVPLSGTGTQNSSQTDTFNQLNDNKVDILWVIDNSGSMSEEQAAISANTGSFIGYADTLGVNYQVATVTTDMDDPSQSGRMVGTPKIIQQGASASSDF